MAEKSVIDIIAQSFSPVKNFCNKCIISNCILFYEDIYIYIYSKYADRIVYQIYLYIFLTFLIIPSYERLYV